MTDLEPTREDLIAALEWQVAMGVDVCLDEAPRDRFAEAAIARAPSAASEPPSAAPRAPSTALLASPQETAGAARQAAASAATLDELRAILDRFDGCALKATASRTVFADGNPAARLMLVGEAPGREEDLSGLPFVGRSGQLLDRMLAAIGLDRSSVYIANVIPWRPPGNRTPTPQETETCLPFIRRQIELCDPDVLVALGGSAAQSLFRAKDGILKLRGRWLDYETGQRSVKAMATLHPAYLLRSPAQKKFAWRDLKAVKRALDGG
ncbi:uracil-DNA glycosylase family protein [Hansschlegelia quercus]|uniref:Type-4 uracil-DNA glycosylase n=1 Tax=Hansschlegelia quercus TaxID=2528245 RepID=A0A4Q9GJK2_9HYPH|nr:uracil-DNA glycosylase [Hansschlegelia quercus]TBN53451.1 uracil-DNA glycosylase [Hansschlegelia quercus]